jgi:hypothetical protein
MARLFQVGVILLQIAAVVSGCLEVLGLGATVERVTLTIVPNILALVLATVAGLKTPSEARAIACFGACALVFGALSLTWGMFPGETWLAGRAPGDLEARCIVIAVVSGSAACGSLFLTVGVATIGRGSRS